MQNHMRCLSCFGWSDTPTSLGPIQVEAFRSRALDGPGVERFLLPTLHMMSYSERWNCLLVSSVCCLAHSYETGIAQAFHAAKADRTH